MKALTSLMCESIDKFWMNGLLQDGARGPLPEELSTEIREVVFLSGIAISKLPLLGT